MKHLKQRKVILSLILLVTNFVVAATAIAQSVRYPTFYYYGEVLSVDEYLALVDKLAEDGTYLNCVQLPSEEFYLLGDRSPVVTDLACFHTLDEVYRHTEAVIVPEQNRLAAEYPDHRSLQSPDEASKALLSGNHWSLFAHTLYSGHLADVHNGTNCQGLSSGVWSIWRDGNPNQLTLYTNSNCTGTSISITQATGGCVWPTPLGCGGMLGAKVP